MVALPGAITLIARFGCARCTATADFVSGEASAVMQAHDAGWRFLEGDGWLCPDDARAEPVLGTTFPAPERRQRPQR